jgi:hypothetical protein
MHKIVSTFVLTLVHFKNFALLYSRVGVGAGAARAGEASQFSPGARAAPQHCYSVLQLHYRRHPLFWPFFVEISL